MMYLTEFLHSWLTDKRNIRTGNRESILRISEMQIPTMQISAA